MDQYVMETTGMTLSSGISRRSALLGGAGAAVTLLCPLSPAPRPAVAQTDPPAELFLVIRHYQLASADVLPELVRRTEEGFAPLIQELDGFVEYYCLDLGDGEGATISIFASQASADRSTEIATEWAVANVADLVQGPPEVQEGPILLHLSADEATG